MKQKALFVAVMVVAWGGFAGFRIYTSMQHAEQAQRALRDGTPFVAQVLSLDAAGRRGGNRSVRLRAAHDPAGGKEPATLNVSFQHFDNVEALHTGAEVDMLYGAGTRDAMERSLLDKQARWTYWLLK